MNSLVIVGGTDITPYINWDSYSMTSEDLFESWLDGNYTEHRIYTRSHMVGSFEVWLCGMDGMDTDAFIALWNSAVSNHIVTLGVYDQASNSTKAINAYYTIEPVKHNEMINGNYFDVFKIEVTER